MRQLPFKIERSMLGGVRDAAYLSDGEDMSTALRDAMWEAVRLNVLITIGGVMMPATMWEDPEHWAEDWAAELGVGLDEAPEAVATIIATSIEGDS
jgi:hypothetical protein